MSATPSEPAPGVGSSDQDSSQLLATERPAVEDQPKLPGLVLRTRREELGWSLADVAQRLKFSTRQIDALEFDDYDKLAGPTFVRGMVRSYAKLLQLDPAPLLMPARSASELSVISTASGDDRIPFPEAERRSTRVYVAFCAVIAFAVGVFSFDWSPLLQSWLPDPVPSLASTRPATVQIKAPAHVPAGESGPIVRGGESIVDDVSGVTTSPSPAKAAAGSEAVATPLGSSIGGDSRAPGSSPADLKAANARIRLQFQSESWVEIKQADGKILISQVNRGGSEQELGGTPPFDVVIGNAPNVKLLYNGRPVDLRNHYKVDVARLVLD